MPQAMYMGFDHEDVLASNPWPMIEFTPIADEGCMFLVQTAVPKMRTIFCNQQERLPKKYDEKEHVHQFEHHFLYVPKGILLMIPSHFAHAEGFSEQNSY